MAARRKSTRKRKQHADPIRGHDLTWDEGGVIVTRDPNWVPPVAPVSYIDPYYLTESWKQKRLYVVRRDNAICQYCGHKSAFMADHIIPRKRGGSDKVKNLVACCARCNKAAGNRLFSSFEAKKAWILEHC